MAIHFFKVSGLGDMLSNPNATGGKGQDDANSFDPAYGARDGRYATYTGAERCSPRQAQVAINVWLRQYNRQTSLCTKHASTSTLKHYRNLKSVVPKQGARQRRSYRHASWR